jgi:hypothetical protein
VQKAINLLSVNQKPAFYLPNKQVNISQKYTKEREFFYFMKFGKRRRFEDVEGRAS